MSAASTPLSRDQTDDGACLCISSGNGVILAIVEYGALPCDQVRTVWAKIAEHVPSLAGVDFEVELVQLAATGRVEVRPDGRIAARR